MKRKSSKRGISEVISSIIMCSLVLTIGASVWSVTQSAAFTTGNTYFNTVSNSISTIEERFCVENIILTNTSKTLYNKLEIWVFNYGSVNVTITQILVKGGGNVSSSYFKVLINVGGIARIDVVPSNIPLQNGLGISLEIVSSRGNLAYGTIRIP